LKNGLALSPNTVHIFIRPSPYPTYMHVLRIYVITRGR
jgi:hypothetical protein